MKLKTILGVYFALLCLAAPASALSGTIDHGMSGVAASAQNTLVGGILQLTNGTDHQSLAFEYSHMPTPGPWHPESSWLLYTKELNGDGVHALASDGSVDNPITTNSNNGYSDTTAQFTPNGGEVIFTFNDSNDYNWKIASIDADGQGFTNLTAVHDNTWEEQDPALSPDGSKIAFTSYFTSTTLLTMDADGSNVVTMAVDIQRGRHYGHSWSPSSDQLVFVSTTDTVRLVSLASPLMPMDLAADSSSQTYDKSPSWSPDGAAIAYINRQGYSSPMTHSIRLIPPTPGAAPTVITSVATSAYDVFEGPLSWSPNSRWLAFTKLVPSSAEKNIWAYDTREQEFHQLTDGYRDSFPFWSPDGAAIAFEDSGDSTTSRDQDHDSGNYEDVLIIEMLGPGFSSKDIVPPKTLLLLN